MRETAARIGVRSTRPSVRLGKSCGVLEVEQERPPTAREMATAADLRRTRPRELADLLVARSEYLMPEDRSLIRAVFRDGMTAQALSDATRARAQRTRKKIRALVRMLLDARYAFVLGHREAWPSERKRVATAVVLQGRTMRGTAAHLRISLHHVRRHMAIVQTLFEEHEAKNQPRGREERGQ